MTGPSAGPSSIGIPKMPITAPRFSGGASRYRIAMPTGISIPPPSPWSTRKIVSIGAVVATAHSAEPAVNNTRATRYTRFEPYRSLSQPASGITAAAASM